MHDVLRQRLIRKIEGLPEEQVYQVLDYIEFMESKYASKTDVEPSSLLKFAEGFEDKLRRTAASPGAIREAFQLISYADKVLSDLSRAGKQILDDLNTVIDNDSATPEEVDEILNVEGNVKDPSTFRYSTRSEGGSAEGCTGE
ncbi:MAG TPA: hypothetical protein DCS75_08930 [Gemmatimonadetes bacterium]|mgnify:CR=1 FL=1|nr:hypothetical protein [Gemmatimonadota bacterium]HAT38606.1 hypothetical protein [Gemmatimonadota bacterium]HBV06848.1 hypothetical protein [Gemmatimonadota bacterium]|tara:strand:- start:32169 stop:32597 length:429 start_codon:yes stop_codon:yes gene_type:complete